MPSSSDDSSLLRTSDLLELARGGQSSAMNELFARFQSPLRAFLHARLPTSARGLQDTDDMVQEVFASTYSALDRFQDRGAGAFWGYLRHLGINHVRQAVRKQQAAKRGKAEPLAESAMEPAAIGVGPVAALLAKEEFEAFESALDCISEQQRTALLMRFELDLDYSEIAEECGYPSPDAARVAIRRASALVATELARDRSHD